MKALYITNILNKYKNHSFSDLEDISSIKKNEYVRQNYYDLLELYDFLFTNEYDNFFEFCNDIHNIDIDSCLNLLEVKEKEFSQRKDKLLLSEVEKQQIEKDKKERKKAFVNSLYNEFKNNNFEDIKRQNKIFFNYFSYIKYITFFITTFFFYLFNLNISFSFSFTLIFLGIFFSTYFSLGVLLQFYIDKKYNFKHNNKQKYKELDILRTSLFKKEHYSLEKFLLNFDNINQEILDKKFEENHKNIPYIDKIKNYSHKNN